MNCHVGAADTWIDLRNPTAIYERNTTTRARCDSGKYPSSITINLSSSAYIRNNGTTECTFKLWLCDSGGDNAVQIGKYKLGSTKNKETAITADISGTGLVHKYLYLKVTDSNGYIVLRNKVYVTVGQSTYEYSITVNSATGGSCTASKTKAAPGSTFTLTPTPDAGYRYAGYSMGGVNYTGTTVTMPDGNASITPIFTKKTYYITITSQTGGVCVANTASAYMGDTITLTPAPNGGYSYAGFTMNGTDMTGTSFTMPAADAAIVAKFTRNMYAITVSSQTGGSCTASATSAGFYDTVTLTPVADAGYTYAGFTLNGTDMAGSSFEMPNEAVTIVALFTKNGYGITLASSPDAGGMVEADRTNASYGDTVTLSQTPAEGYYFTGWTTNPSVTIDGTGKFSMPNSAITVTANYKHRSEGTLRSTTLVGGTYVRLDIDTESLEYRHECVISFGEGMSTGSIYASQGIKTVGILIPLGWSNQIPNDETKTGGTLTLNTYSGTTLIGTYEITGLTYVVPESAVPTVTGPTISVARTIDGVTYANLDQTYGDIVAVHFPQGHCGVRVQASAAGALGSTVSHITVKVNGYDTSRYQTTVNASNVDFTSGLLYTAGQTVVTVEAVDSRGRSKVETYEWTVEAYDNPKGTLSAWRVDANGDTDPNGQYGKFAITKSYSQIGTNTLTVTLDCGSLGSVNNPATTGDLLPGDRKTFSEIQEFEIALILTDKLETTRITARLPSGRYVIFVTADGRGIAFMKAVSQTPTAPKTSVLEISADTQVYIGNDTLEDYIRDIVQNM